TNQVLQRFDVRFIIRVSNFLGKIPFAKSLFFKIKSIKHKLNETGITINKDVQRREGEDKNSSSWELTDECLAQLESYNKSKSRKKKYALITAQFGSYEQLVLPLNISKEFDYICFTDSSHNTYGLWQLRQSPFFHKDPVRMARYVKTHINSLLPEYEAVIWCDANIRVSNEIYLKFDGFLASDSDISLISHPHRTNIFEEAEACVRLSKDEGHIIYKQIDRYKDEKVGYSTGLYETGLHFVNLTSPMLSEFYKLWWKEIINGSRRDQIAIVYAIEKSKLKISDLFEPGVCVRTSNHTQIIQHSILKYMSTPKQLSKYNSIEDPTHSKTFRSDLGIDKTTDIIICVYNALEDVKLCLNSVLECSLNDVNKVIIIDDCSSKDTSEYLKMVVSKYNKLVLIRNELNQGYTKSANIGLKTSDADFRIILNSDTIVTQGWIKKLSALAFSHDNIGIVGPISNAAGSQSVPSIKKSDKNQTAINMLPKGYTINDMNNVAEGGLFQYPTIPLIHGFCIGIKRTVIDEIGFFDEVNFARYYGEENDYCLRAYKAGFDLKIATDTYIFHSKSKSIEEEERILHMSEAGRRLREIYGSQEMRDYCFQLDNNPVLVEVRDYFDKRCYS
ncbi:glycosyltransferase, partial [Vibrio cholerae]